MPRFQATFLMGKDGEEFVTNHMNSLTSDFIHLNTDSTADKHLEGLDIFSMAGVVLREGYNLVPDWGGKDLAGLKQYEVCFNQVRVEVKTILNFLTRTNDGEDQSGTLPFELLKGNRKKKTMGWLHTLLHPSGSMSIADAPEEQFSPQRLAFLLVQYKTPFACILFENFNALKTRLQELAHDAGIDLDTMTVQGSAENDDTFLIGNVWHIPFSKLSDLAVVTMIGEQPLLRPDIVSPDGMQRCSFECQQARYAYLQECAGSRWLELEDEEKEYMKTSPEDTFFANVVHNLKVLHDWYDEYADDYPSLTKLFTRNKSMLSHLRGVLLNMLARERPTWPERSPRYVLMTYKYLEEWCKHLQDHPIRGVHKAWVSHIVILVKCGLIKNYQPSNTSDDPKLRELYQRSQQHGGLYRHPPTFRSVPRYTEEVLNEADRQAERILTAKVKASKITKSSMINAVGQEEANRLYHDGRKIPADEKKVAGIFTALIQEAIDQKGYARKEGVVEGVQQRLKEQEGFRHVSPFDDSKEGTAEIDRQMRWRKIAQNLENRFPEIAASMGCEYRPVRAADRERFNFSAEDKAWIVVKKDDVDN